MKLSEILNEIYLIAKNNKLATPYICGGTPRDKVMDKISNFSDLDLTTGNGDIHKLSKLVFQRFQPFGAKYKEFPDTHSQIIIEHLKFDFSSNFLAPRIGSILQEMNIKVTPMIAELYSRDFTCNALLMNMQITEILDPMNKGIKDIKEKRLVTCLSPELTLGYDNKRVARVFYLAAKLEFDVEPNILLWIKNNPSSLTNARLEYLNKKMLQAFQYDVEKTSKLLDITELWSYLPTTPALIPYIKDRI